VLRVWSYRLDDDMIILLQKRFLLQTDHQFSRSRTQRQSTDTQPTTTLQVRQKLTI